MSEARYDLSVEPTPIEISGEMDQQNLVEPKFQLANILQFPTHLPHAKEWLTSRRQNVRPWLQFVQTSNFKVPASVPRLSRRIMRNIEYFQSNYLFVFLGLIAYCLYALPSAPKFGIRHTLMYAILFRITSPLLLLAITGSFFAGYKLSKRHESKKLTLFGHELTLAQQYGLVSLCSMPVYYLAGAGAAMFWVLGASFFVITLHAAFYNIDACIAEEDTFVLTQEV